MQTHDVNDKLPQRNTDSENNLTTASVQVPLYVNTRVQTIS